MEISEYKRGWYKKGKTLRYVLALSQEGTHTFVLYQTKTQRIKKIRETTGVNVEFDEWFPKAEYIGLELPAS